MWLIGNAYVYRNGNLVGDLCLEDLPGANLDTFDKLTLPCIEYVKVSFYFSRTHIHTQLNDDNDHAYSITWIRLRCPWLPLILH